MDYISLVRKLATEEHEQPWLEFKRSNSDPKMIGRSISALSNSVLVERMGMGFMVWGVDDETHEIVGTTFDPDSMKIGSEDLTNWLRQNLSDSFDFFFRSVVVDGKNVVVLTVTPPSFTAAEFQHIAYIRDGSHTSPLSKIPPMQSIVTNRTF